MVFRSGLRRTLAAVLAVLGLGASVAPLVGERVFVNNATVGPSTPPRTLILVSNDRYELGSGEGFGSRRRIDGGNLGIVAATFRSSSEIARFIESAAAGRSWRPPGATTSR